MPKTNSIREISTDLSNPEHKNRRYFRSWWQKNRSWLFGADLDEPQQHSESKHFIWRLFDSTLKLKRNFPKTARFFQYFVPLVLLASIPFSWMVLPSIIAISASALLAVQIAITVTSILSLVISSLNQWVITNIFGEHVAPFDSFYQNSSEELAALLEERAVDDGLSLEILNAEQQSISLKRGSATATLVTKDGYMPKLSIKAANHADAGYLEGYMQGKQMDIALKQLNYLYSKIRAVIGAPSDDADLKKYLTEIEKTLPHYYIDEMKAKVAGYNQWRDDNGLATTGHLEYYKYLLLQLLPDSHHYNPFKVEKDKLSISESLNTALKSGKGVGSGVDLVPGCTTIAFKIGDYTCYVRVLDWPGYNIAGKSFIEVERAIDGYKKVTDTSLCLISGCVTAVNENDVLTQINVSRVKKVGPKGMPGAFFIRYLAEHAESIQAMKDLLKTGDEFIKQGPLSGMHVSATDGTATVSLHTEQDIDGGHILECLGDRPLVVPNFGYNPETGELVDHHDSCARLENINYFFKHNPKERVLQGKNTESECLAALREYMSLIMKLNLVNNCESVFSGMYIYSKGKLVDSRAAVDNTFSGSRDIDGMYKLSAAH